MFEGELKKASDLKDEEIRQLKDDLFQAGAREALATRLKEEETEAKNRAINEMNAAIEAKDEAVRHAKYYKAGRDQARASYEELIKTKSSEKTTIEKGKLTTVNSKRILDRTVHERQSETTIKRTAETAFGLNDSGRIYKTQQVFYFV